MNQALRQPSSRPPVATVVVEPSWWVNLDREAFYAQIAARVLLMRASKMSRYVADRVLE